MPPKLTGELKCLKGLHVLGCILLIIAGICELIIGAIIMIWLGKNLYVLGPAFITIPSILLGLGFVCIILAILGLYGCARANECILKTYTALVILLFLVEIVIAILTSVESNRIESGVEMSVNLTITDYYDNEIAKQKADEMQKTCT
uniref:Tetraspanin-6 n=1 Tax=Schistocephalus solidus TaxID=70667 RepID=A0A0X3P217_SCHSO